MRTPALRRRRAIVAVAGLWAAATLAGCAIHQDSMRELEPALRGQPRVPPAVDPELARAIEAYAAVVRALPPVPDPPDEPAMRRALTLLADALEKVPSVPAQAVGLREAAARIRQEARTMELGVRVEGRPLPLAARALATAAVALTRIADVSYPRAAVARERARELARAVRQIDPEAPARQHRAEVARALAAALVALQAIAQAAPPR